jgi:magnesium and cobalt transporter
MSDDKPPSSHPIPLQKKLKSTSIKCIKTWFNKLTHAFQEIPQDRQDLISVLKTAEQNSLLSSDLLSMMEGVIHISELQARDIMVIRPQMIVLNHLMPFNEMLRIILQSGHSRFPVIGDHRDDILGIIHAKDLLQFCADTSSPSAFTIKAILREAPLIPESKKLDTLLKEFRTNRKHMAIVVDEYGIALGLVTIEDVLEQIVGEIVDEYDIKNNNHSIKKIAPNEFVLKGTTDIKEFNHYFSSHLGDDAFETVSGLLLQAFGHVPVKDESIAIKNFKFEIIAANSRKIKQIRVAKINKTQQFKG